CVKPSGHHLMGGNSLNVW
nr:immunoglobulin heavy chain junction region [Macaca mulatta]